MSEPFVAQLGRISGKLLSDNLVRNGTPLTFRNGPVDADLLYLDVNNARIGINTNPPTEALDITGSSRISTNMLVTGTAATIDNIILNTSGTVTSTVGPIIISPTGADAVVQYGKVLTPEFEIKDNRIRGLDTNSDITLDTSGTGKVDILASTDIAGNLAVVGNIQSTGNVSLDGQFIIGDSPVDTIAIAPDFTQSILPGLTNTYDFGTAVKRWRDLYLYDMNGADAVTTQNLVISDQVQFTNPNTISTLQSNDNLIVSSASGVIRIDDISIKKTSTIGLTRLKYAGYADLDSQWFAGKTPVETTVLTAGVIQGFDSFTSPSSTTPFSFLYTGFFLAPTTATYTFTIFADEKAYIWLGNYAIAGYTNINANAYSDYFTSHTGTFSVALTAGQFYPIRLQWSNLGGPGDLTTFTWANDAGQATTSDFTGRVFTHPHPSPASSLSFSGSNYLSLSTAQTIGTQAYTFECFFYTASNGLQTLLGAAASGGMSVWLFGDGINPVTTIQIDRSGVDAAVYTVSPITVNTWHHIAVTRDSLNNASVFLDGVKATGSASNAANYTGPSGLIGAVAGSAYFFTGYLTQIKLAVGSNYYDPTAASIAVPTAVLTTSANTKLLLTVANSGAYLTDTSGTQTVSNIGGVTYSASSPIPAGVEANTITNLTNGALTLSHTGQGYLTINDTNAFRIPFGTTAERTAYEVGATRWNSEIGYMECFDGGVWQVATGGGIVITAPIMEELGHVYTLIFG